MKKDRIAKKYNELFSARTWDTTISNRLVKMEEDPDIDELREFFCDKLLHKMMAGYFDYPGMRSMRKDGIFQLYEDNVKKLPHSCSKHWMAYSCYKGKDEEFYKHFKSLVKNLEQSKGDITEDIIADSFIIPLKDALPGFWSRAQRKLSSLCVDEATSKLCKLMGKYYDAETYEEAYDCLVGYVRKYPNMVVAKEFLAHTCDELGRWEEEIAYLEGISEAKFFADCMEDYYFWLAWAHGKLREYDKEEEYYHKSIEINKECKWANNNLGLCLYKQKKYAEAEKVFYKCVSRNLDLPNSAYNYVRTLLKEGKNKEAKTFTRSSEHITAASFIEKVESYPNKNTGPDTTAGKGLTGNKAVSSGVRKGTKKLQFSSEKALEDELVAKLRAGEKVFGKKLKIYRKKGKYGRQYITPVGIIDILCEDYKGDIYVIELKKDSGYKDAYEQILNYMDWFSSNKEFKNKNVYGIICLNSPSAALIRKIRNDDKVSLYEYHISFSEFI